jgi:hypothetical protein
MRAHMSPTHGHRADIGSIYVQSFAPTGSNVPEKINVLISMLCLGAASAATSCCLILACKASAYVSNVSMRQRRLLLTRCLDLGLRVEVLEDKRLFRSLVSQVVPHLLCCVFGIVVRTDTALPNRVCFDKIIRLHSGSVTHR